jgi:hypothetical protein
MIPYNGADENSIHEEKAELCGYANEKVMKKQWKTLPEYAIITDAI